MIKDIRHFTNELNMITDITLRNFVTWYLESQTPDYFWTSGASSSGKFHPKFSQGLGGLVRHTKSTILFADELLRLNTYGFMPQRYKDYAIAALLMHDTRKYGEMADIDKAQYKYHGPAAAIAVKNAWWEYFDGREDCPEMLWMAIASHMGQWEPDKDCRPFTQIDRLVHMADYMSSRSFIDIAEISEDWEIVAAIDKEGI